MPLIPKGKSVRTRARGCKLIDIVELQDIAELYGCHPNTIRKWLRSGGLSGRTLSDVVKDYCRKKCGL